MNCTYCKVKQGVLAYCSKGHWQKQDGTQKRVMSWYVPQSSIAKMAEYCDDYDEEEPE